MEEYDVAGSINSVLNSLDFAGQDMITVLGGTDGLGFKLLAVLFGIMIFYNVVIFMLEGSGKIMVDLTKLTITWMILASMLAAWTSPASTGVMRDLSVAGFFLKTIPDLSDSFTKGNTPTAEIVDKHVQAMGNVFKVLLKKQDFEPLPGESQIEPKGLGSKLISVGEGVWDTIKQPFLLMNDAVSLIISSLLLVIAAFFILWSLLTFVFILNAGQVMLYIGLALGPVLIPFLLISSLSFLFNGWLRFMIAAALYKVVAVLVALLALGTIDRISTYSSGMATKDESMIFLSLMVLFFAMLGKQLMGLADNMASTLATGGANSGGAGDSSKLVMFGTRMQGSRAGKESTSKPSAQK